MRSWPKREASRRSTSHDGYTYLLHSANPSPLLELFVLHLLDRHSWLLSRHHVTTRFVLLKPQHRFVICQHEKTTSASVNKPPTDHTYVERHDIHSPAIKSSTIGLLPDVIYRVDTPFAIKGCESMCLSSSFIAAVRALRDLTLNFVGLS